MEIVLPFVLMDTCPVADKLDKGGAENTIWLALVPDSVRLMPLNPSVLPDAVVLPDVFAPSRLTLLFSAAAPGAATDAVMIPPALVPHVTLLALLKFSVVNANEPFDADAAGDTPPPVAPEITTLPFDMPTDAPPAPANTRPLRLIVPLLACVVLLAAEAVTVPTPRLIVDPFELADKAPVALKLEVAGPIIDSVAD